MNEKIIVIGDRITDKYYYCTKKHNPENTAPCYQINKEEEKPGGASNVVECLKKLGSPVLDLTLGGTVKERIYVNNKYKCRIDKDKIIENPWTERILGNIKESKAEYIIVSDYNKGYLTKEFCEKLEKVSKQTNKRLILDIKPCHLEWFKNPFLLKPNEKEFREMNLYKYGNKPPYHILVTLGNKGMRFYDKKCHVQDWKVLKSKKVDVTGAGDCVIATLTHFLNKGYDMGKAILYANKAASISITKIGCFCPTECELFH